MLRLCLAVIGWPEGSWRRAGHDICTDTRVIIKNAPLSAPPPPHSPQLHQPDDDLFNPDYVEVDRVLDVAVTTDSDTGEVGLAPSRSPPLSNNNDNDNTFYLCRTFQKTQKLYRALKQ